MRTEKLRAYQRTYQREYARKNRPHVTGQRRQRRADMTAAERDADRAYQRRYIRINKDRVNLLKAKRRERPEGVAYDLVDSAKRRCAKRKLPFDLAPADILPTLKFGLCEVTGLPFDMKKLRGRSPFTPSLDRKIPALGYVRENIQVVVWALNAMRGEWGDEILLQIADALRRIQ